MSKIALKGNLSGTATFTIESPDSNTDRTLNLPDAGGTLVTTESISSEALTKDFPMASGGSLTAGKAVSLTSAGEVGAYPVLNTLGTERENATDTTGYGAISTDGSRAIRVASSAPGGSTTATFVFTGVALSSSANAVVGGTTQTVTVTLDLNTSGFPLPTSAAIVPLTGTVFLAVVGYVTYGNNAVTRNIYKVVALSVDASGNVTKGNELTRGQFTSGSSGADPIVFGSILTIDSQKFVLRVDAYSTGSTIVPRYSSITVSGTTIAFAVQDEGSEAASFIGGVNTLTSSNRIVNFSGTSYRIGTWNNGIETSVTTTSLVTDLFPAASIFWGVLDPTRAVAIYKDTNERVVLVAYSITASTGVVTKVSDFVLLPDASLVAFKDVNFAAKSATEFVYAYRLTGSDLSFFSSASLDGSGNILGINIPTSNSTLVTTPRYNTGNVFFMNYYLARQRLRPYTVNAYATPAFSYIGIAGETTSGATSKVVVAGIAGNMSGLTPNTLYYSAFNGDITTSSSSGIFVGKAVSSTEILLGAT
jgi:hypothetical protein